MTKIRSIFRKFAASIVLVAAWAFLLPLAACAKEPSENGTITMTTRASEVRIAIKLAKGSDNLTIVWGDGKESNVNDAIHEILPGWFVYTHDYSGTTEHNIVITCNATGLDCRGGNQLTALDVSRCTSLTELNFGENQLTALDVSKNTALERLSCNFNQITHLDVSKNTTLWLLEVVGNQFTAAALNDLFRTLPDRSKLGPEYVGGIHISTYSGGGNPGNNDCECSIAEARGWSFHSIR